MGKLLGQDWRWLQKGALVLALTLGVVAPVGAQSDDATKFANILSSELKKQYSTSEQLDAAVTKTYGVKLSPEKAQVARDALRALMFNPNVPAYLAKLVLPLLRSGVTAVEVKAATLEGILQLQVKGLARLPTERQAYFVTHMVAMARALTPSTCKAVFLGEASAAESAELERAYIAQLPLEKFKAITRLYREASEAELEGFPDARVINAQQAKLAENVFERAAMKRALALVPLAAVQRIGSDASGAPAAEVCTYMTAYTEAILDMTEPYRAWKLTRFAQSMQ